jgi:UDP-glucose 4-epimerase
MKIKKVFITGCSGFLGSYIVKNLLLTKKFEVFGIDNFSRYGYVKHDFYKNKNFTLIKGDCKNFNLINKYIKKSDYVIANAAIVGGIKKINENQFQNFIENQKIIETTLTSSINAYRKFHMQKIIFISSSMIYEKNKKKVSSEGDEARSAYPQSYYAFQKLCAERLIQAAHDQFKIPYTIIRPFNIIGSFEQANPKYFNHVIPDLIKKIKKNKKRITLYGNGSQKRSFTSARDISEIVVRCLKSKKTDNKIYNAGKNNSLSIKSLTKLIFKKINPNDKLIIKKGKTIKNDVLNNQPNISKIKKDINFCPKISVNEVLTEMLNE